MLRGWLYGLLAAGAASVAIVCGAGIEDDLLAACIGLSLGLVGSLAGMVWGEDWYG